jgi:hypothetical protein
MKTRAFVAAATLAFAFLPALAPAQQMNLQIQDGRVTLEAQNVSVRQILAEWARVGGARIVNGEKVAGAPLTLQLQGMPERQALDIILRNVSGYMLAARQPGTAGLSAFDRILILPTSSAPRAASAPPPVTGFPTPGMNRRMPVEPTPADEVEVEDGDNDTPEPEEEPVNEGEGEATGPNTNRFQRRGQVFPNPAGMPPQPFPTQPGMPSPQPGAAGAPAVPGAQPPNAANPFGVPPGASATPGVVTPVPQDPNAPPRRPPST